MWALLAAAGAIIVVALIVAVTMWIARRLGKSPKLAVIIEVTVAVVGLTLFVYFEVVKSTEPAVSAASITCSASGTQGSFIEPHDHDVVTRTTLASGTICNISEGHEIILMLLYGDCYFPERVQIAPDNRWWGEIRIGGDEAKGLDFILYLVDIGPEGVSELEAYGAAERQGGNPVGICSKDEVVDKYQGSFLDGVPIKRDG